MNEMSWAQSKRSPNANPVDVTKYREKPAAAQSEATTAGPVPKNQPSMISTSRSICAAVGPLTGGPSSSSTSTATATDDTAKVYRRRAPDERWNDSLVGTTVAPLRSLLFTSSPRLSIVLYDACDAGI